jgi:outer membrane protein insertion porin family
MTPFLHAVVLFAAAQAPPAQEEDWDGKVIEEVRGDRAEGWSRYRFKSYRDRLQLKKGQVYTKAMRDSDIRTLFKEGLFGNVDIKIEKAPVAFFCPTHPAVRKPDKGSCPAPCLNILQPDMRWMAQVLVEEYQIVKDVVFSGVTAVPMNTLIAGLRLRQNDRLNPYLLKVDEDYLRELYIMKGYYFFTVKPELVTAQDGDVIVHWQVLEGPLVTVGEIKFTGLAEKDADEIRKYLLSKEPGTFLFIPTGGEPFIEHNLDEDLKRIRLYFWLEGWLDVGDGERIFVEDLRFSRDKSSVAITIHCDLGRRYTITKIAFKGNKLFTEQELRETMKEAREGGDYSENTVGRDTARIREKYGERAYILAEVAATHVVDRVKPEVTILYTIQENQEVSVGRIVIQGNTKTRTDVILRELKDFTPGEKFNNKLLSKGISRLRDRGYFDAQGGIVYRTEAGGAPNERDVVIDVKEGPTGNIRFAGGFSSSFGILGILEFTQKNFDLTDLPKDWDDLISGNAFAGGGQILRLRAQPAAKRQSYLAEFREPYVFGYEFGGFVRGLNTTTSRRDYAEERLSGAFGIEKRFDPIRVELGFEAARIDIKNIDVGAPVDTFAVEGTNYIYTLTPGVVLDTRNSILFPSSGVKVALSYEFAGLWLGGDWDYGKFMAEAEAHWPLYENEDKHVWVLSADLRFGWAEPFGDSDSIPIFERFYAGGRDSIRGFEFRGVGPHENGNPVGGAVRLSGTIEVGFPLFGEFLRGAFFYDIANISVDMATFGDDKFRNSVGFGIRFLIPQLGNIPVALDFGFPLSKEDDDERQTVTFDIGKLF